jgi:hypothetical protein
MNIERIQTENQLALSIFFGVDMDGMKWYIWSIENRGMAESFLIWDSGNSKFKRSSRAHVEISEAHPAAFLRTAHIVSV